MRLSAVETALGNMVEVHQENHKTISNAFFMTDAHLWVLKNIAQDIAKDAVMKTDEGELDLEKYYERFNDNQKKMRAEAEAKKEESAEGGGDDSGGDEEAPGTEVFGGDLDGTSTNGDEVLEGQQSPDQDDGDGRPEEATVPSVQDSSSPQP